MKKPTKGVIELLMFKKIGLSILAVMLLVPFILIPSPQMTAAEASTNAAVIREGSTYLLNFQSDSMASGTYYDGKKGG